MATTQKFFNILIFGAGAVGSTLGWRLAQNSRVRLSVVCRSNYDAVKQNGVQMRTRLWGNGVLRPFYVARSTHEFSGMTFDYVICANKVITPDNQSFIGDLSRVVSPETTLVSAQNGVGVEAPLRRAFQRSAILSAVCYVSCTQPSAGIVAQVSNIRPHAFHIGTYDTIEYDRSKAIEKLKVFAAFDAAFKRVEDVKAERWIKQVFNGAWNPMTAISGLETHQLLASPFLPMVLELAKETCNVAVQSGVSLSADLPIKTIELARTNPSLAPSMLQDSRNQRLMEVESLCGNIVRHADQIRVPVPTVRLVYHKLLEMNSRILASTVHPEKERDNP